MSNFTNYAENKVADMIRGSVFSLSSLYIGLASAASDSAVTELTGTGYARVTVARTLLTWSGTQGAGTTTASSGTSHITSNNGTIDFGTAGSAWGTANYVVVFDALSSGNALFYVAITPISIGNGDPVSFAAGAIAFALGLSGGCTNYLSNKLIDYIFRGQSYSFPANMYLALFTTAPTNAGGGVEVNVGSYGRVAIAGTTSAWSGTQGTGTTSDSSGTSGRISNNGILSFPTPTASWGTVVAEGLYDASGNLLFWKAITPRSLDLGVSAPTHQIDTVGITIA